MTNPKLKYQENKLTEATTQINLTITKPMTMFPKETLSFEVSKPIRSSKDMSISTDTIKYFLDEIGERNSFKKMPKSYCENKASSESSVNEVMEAVIAGENDPSTKDPFHNVTDENGLMELFDQFSGLILVTGKKYYLFQKSFLGHCCKHHSCCKICIHKVMSASGANLGPKGQCDLKFRLGNKQFTDSFIVLQDLHRKIILGLNGQCNYRLGCQECQWPAVYYT